MLLDLWYKNAVIYCLDVDTFQDSNGDGIGDFPGLQSRLDHIVRLGANCIWLLPFYPSPDRDNGFDVCDYYAVDPRLGSLGDFVEFLRQAHERGIRVVCDLVVNHTSDRHPWFQAARRDKRSRYRDWYVWSAEKPANADDGVVFPGVQESTWSWDEAAQAWYFHRFYAHQPDLNVANPAVRDEICRIMGFWLELGVSGFRLDAAPFIIEQPGLQQPMEGDPHRYLRQLREFVGWRRAEAMFLAEANVPPDGVDEYVGDGDRMHMLFNFWANQHLFLALARSSAEPLRKALDELPALPKTAQWASFLRNHDELDLGRLSDAERREVFARFAPEERMRLYGRGIRRRLAPLLGGDRRRLELAYSLLLTLPGTPVIWSGDEIGMGEDLDLEERNAVRTPMQWCAGANAGFSDAPASSLVRPVVRRPPFGCEQVNVAAQRRDRDSLLSWLERRIRVRRETPEFGWGAARLLDTGRAEVLAHRCDWDERCVAAIHNFSGQRCTARVRIDDPARGKLIDLLDNGTAIPFSGGEIELALEGSGYRWFKIVPEG